MKNLQINTLFNPVYNFIENFCCKKAGIMVIAFENTSKTKHYTHIKENIIL